MTTSSKAPARLWLQPLLSLLTLWAVWQAFSVLWRPGFAPTPPLPDRVRLHGQWLPRHSASAPHSDLPVGLAILSGADYSVTGSPRVLARWLVHHSSGDGVSFPMREIGIALTGHAIPAQCRVYSASTGRLLGIADHAEAIQALLRRNDPTGLQRLQWALGLRPWRLNRCLYVGIAPKAP